MKRRSFLQLLGVVVGAAATAKVGHVSAETPVDPVPPAPPTKKLDLVPQNVTAVSVLDYGAVGDGVTDDRAAIVACTAACVAAGGGVVYFPRGTYVLSKDGANPYSIATR